MNCPFDIDSEVAWAWAAGLFEGEGHIAYGQYTRGHPGYPAYRRGLVLGMCDEDCVRLFHRVVGVGQVAFRPQPKDHPDWSPTWRWQCQRWTDIEATLLRLLPYLGTRRTEKAEELLANPARYPNERLKTHCLRGHPLSGDNVYRPPGKPNTRVCRECVRIRGRAHDKKRRAA